MPAASPSPSPQSILASNLVEVEPFHFGESETNSNVCFTLLGGMYGMPPPMMDRYGMGLPPMGPPPMVSVDLTVVVMLSSVSCASAAEVHGMRSFCFE